MCVKGNVATAKISSLRRVEKIVLVRKKSLRRRKVGRPFGETRTKEQERREKKCFVILNSVIVHI